jgi:hypothetical protein
MHRASKGSRKTRFSAEENMRRYKHEKNYDAPQWWRTFYAAHLDPVLSMYRVWAEARKATKYDLIVGYVRRHQPIPIWKLGPALRVMLRLDKREVEQLLKDLVLDDVLEVEGPGYYRVRSLERLILLDHYAGTQITEYQEGI